jgi:hypothetical protein
MISLECGCLKMTKYTKLGNKTLIIKVPRLGLLAEKNNGEMQVKRSKIEKLYMYIHFINVILFAFFLLSQF